MKAALALLLLGGYLLVVNSTSEPFLPFGPEVPFTEHEITIVDILKHQIAGRIRQQRPGPPITFFGVISYRLREFPPPRRNEYLIKLQVNRELEFWGVRIAEPQGSPLVLQDVFGPLRPNEPLQDLNAPLSPPPLLPPQ